jgi:hypothetical protein
MFPAAFDLAKLDGKNGFIINGHEGNGYTVSGTGDVNDDGIDDVVIGSYRANDYSGLGQSYVVFGNSNGFSEIFNLTNLDGKNGFAINGKDGYRGGFSVSGIGDINNDGVADILFGSYLLGQAYVIFGSKEFTSPFYLPDVNGVNGFAITSNDNGYFVNGVGDVNGDGIPDIGLGAPSSVQIGNCAAYIIYGSNSAFPNPLNLATLNGQNGFSITGGCVNTINKAGDINNDGVDDIILGNPNANSYYGQAYIIYGSKNGFSAIFNLANLNGITGFIIKGINYQDDFAYSVNKAGDINADGINDFIIGSGFWGLSYVIFGNSNGFPNPFDLATLDGKNGFAISGAGTGTKMVSNAGDINNDGIADVIIGWPDSFGYPGKGYVIFGSREFTTPFLLSTLNGTNGFAINSMPSANANLGWSVSNAGDVNHDGIGDAIICAPFFSYAPDTGQCYVIYGQNNSNFQDFEG